MHTPTPNPHPRQLIKVVAAAELLGLSRSQVYVLMGRGDLAYVKIGHSTRIELAVLHAYMDHLAKATFMRSSDRQAHVQHEGARQYNGATTQCSQPKQPAVPLR